MSISTDYLPLIVIAGFAFTTLLVVEWEGRIRPMLIPRVEIERMADELIGQYGKRAGEMAVIEEDRAWRYSNDFEQGKWRRVRKALRRRSDR